MLDRPSAKMKNQYFGDANDFRKYGLLRTLQRTADLNVGVCWCLTDDDGGGGGERRTYHNPGDGVITTRIFTSASSAC